MQLTLGFRTKAYTLVRSGLKLQSLTSVARKGRSKVIEGIFPPRLRWWQLRSIQYVVGVTRPPNTHTRPSDRKNIPALEPSQACFHLSIPPQGGSCLDTLPIN